MNITVIGCGRWGTFIAWYLDKNGHYVSLYGRQDSKRKLELESTRTNGLTTLSEAVNLTSDLTVTQNSDIIIISINSQNLANMMEELKPLNLENKIIVLCMKGLIADSGKRLSEVVVENTSPSNKVAVWIGPGHVQEFCRGIPNCMVIDSDDEKAKTLLIKEFSSNLIRFYYGQDLIGNEIGAASKNVIGIAAGMLDGIQLSTLKGSLMSRGTQEISRLIEAMGGNKLSAYGLCHLGDYEATVFSQYSHNRMLGECFVSGKQYAELAEGYYTVKALKLLGERYNVDLPICTAVYDILFNNQDALLVLDILFSRSLKNEF